ncbi:sugar (Glycoside-Pentoside-Hexuronide) transporter [Coriobacterium glomerans PW2]|uniref:Sugar (Glycoside-Pentoside-Hexuronide) transporter n=1 Tax=Coriobacterium glomerans (strain ATCC 49209 / DSM 20642 / JCM 10262 / PW2) TaxID=700015 RepID=F2N824_CORGP|nr:glycoside-pentoside-hexuronide (GPH):cation symporter [Coriobacterium glomerans]AEB07207.1 sugar (Glycoside-Pentoside-Hexuronide) transporter [Coriobacterium glomerans PW2]
MQATISIEKERSKEEFPAVLSLREKLAYGLGDVGSNFLFDTGQLFLLKYFTDVVGLNPMVAGGVFLVAKIWDAFADVGVGTWIDNRRRIGPRGRFRPFMLWAALPLGILMVSNFMIPNVSITAQEIWAYVSYIVFGTVYSISNVAFGSMQPAMTRNSVERSQLSAWRNMGSNMGNLLTTVGFIPIVLLLPTQRIGYTVAAVVFAILGVACQLISYRNIKENYHDEARDNAAAEVHSVGRKELLKDVLRSYRSVFRNKPLLVLCLANLFTFSAYNVKLAVQFYFAQYVLHDITIVSYMTFVTMGFAILGSAMIPVFSRRLGKKQTYIMACMIWAISDGIGYFLTNSGWTFAFFTSVSYFGNGLITGLNWALISDVVDYGEWKTHVRSEGIVYSSYTYFRKLSLAAAGSIPGFILAFIGYVPNHEQTAFALEGIRGLVFLYPVAGALLTMVLMWFYPITERKYTDIMLDLQQRRNKSQLDRADEKA